MLPNGQVIVAGGVGLFDPISGSGYLASAETYDPAAGAWRTVENMAQARALHTATLLRDGRVVAAGGREGPPLGSAEVYTSGS